MALGTVSVLNGVDECGTHEYTPTDFESAVAACRGPAGPAFNPTSSQMPSEPIPPPHTFYQPGGKRHRTLWQPFLQDTMPVERYSASYKVVSVSERDTGRAATAHLPLEDVLRSNPLDERLTYEHTAAKVRVYVEHKDGNYVVGVTLVDPFDDREDGARILNLDKQDLFIIESAIFESLIRQFHLHREDIFVPETGFSSKTIAVKVNNMQAALKLYDSFLNGVYNWRRVPFETVEGEHPEESEWCNQYLKHPGSPIEVFDTRNYIDHINCNVFHVALLQSGRDAEAVARMRDYFLFFHSEINERYGTGRNLFFSEPSILGIDHVRSLQAEAETLDWNDPQKLTAFYAKIEQMQQQFNQLYSALRGHPSPDTRVRQILSSFAVPVIGKLVEKGKVISPSNQLTF